VSTYPGFYAVPGSMFPGAIWPGDGALPPVGPAAVFTLGTPYFRRAAGEPYFRWTAGDPYLS
jgi:hypothetical protein